MNWAKKTLWFILGIVATVGCFILVPSHPGGSASFAQSRDAREERRLNRTQQEKNDTEGSKKCGPTRRGTKNPDDNEPEETESPCPDASPTPKRYGKNPEDYE